MSCTSRFVLQASYLEVLIILLAYQAGNFILILRYVSYVHLVSLKLFKLSQINNLVLCLIDMMSDFIEDAADVLPESFHRHPDALRHGSIVWLDCKSQRVSTMQVCRTRLGVTAENTPVRALFEAIHCLKVFA